MKRTLRFVATLLTLCLLVGIPSVSASYFADVSTDSLDRETFDAINYVSDNGWITGTSSTTFSPNNLLNRAMFVTILYRMSGSSEKFSSSFTDVSSSAYYYDAVGWASHYGIINGISETQFAPNHNLTREQLFVILHRYATSYLGQIVTISHLITDHPDYSNVASYARIAFRWAKSYHILQIGNTEYLSPKGFVSRADAALFLTRFSREVIGFVASDRFSFTNRAMNFPSKHEMDDATLERMLYCIDVYYSFSSAEKNREIILNKLNQDWKGSCQGIAFCTYFDKIGKLDFNKNFSGAKTMRGVTPPVTSAKVMGAITYYQIAQYLTGFDYHCYRTADGNLAEGVAALHDQINNNGATLCCYGSATGGHAFNVTKSTYNASKSTYTLYLVDPNYPSVPTVREIDLSDNGPTITVPNSNPIVLTRVGFYREDDCDFLDYFDLDGAFNDMDYSKDVYGTMSYDENDDLFCAADNALLSVPCIPFTITNAEGKTLAFDGADFSGTIEVLDSKYIPQGEGNIAEMQLAVKKSDKFIFDSAADHSIGFAAISDDYFGSIAGSNLQCITIDMQEQLISVDGQNMEYRIVAETDIPGHDYVSISGLNPSSFSIQTCEDTVLTNGLVCSGNVRLIDSNLSTVHVATLEFTAENLLDFSNIASTGVFRFIDSKSNSEIHYLPDTQTGDTICR